MPKRYYEPLEVEFGNSTVLVEPLRGLVAHQALDKSVTKLLTDYGASITASTGIPGGSLDPSEQIKLGLPAVTDEMIENSTAGERLGLIQDILDANNLGALKGFFVNFSLIPEKMSEMMGRNMDKALAEVESSPIFSEPELAGMTSSTS